MIRYAVKVPFDDEMMYITEGDTKFQLRVKLFNSKPEAEQHADLWGDQAVVVEYIEESEIL